MSFHELYTFIQTNIQNNQFFQGAVGAAIFGGIIYQAKSWLMSGWTLLLRTTSVSLTVNNECELHFLNIMNWIEKEGLHKSTRNVEVKSSSGVKVGTFDYEYEQLSVASCNVTPKKKTNKLNYVTPNDFYYAFYKFLPVKIRFSSTASEMNREIKRTVTITFYLRGLGFISKLKTKINDFVQVTEDTVKTTSVKRFSNLNDRFDWDVVKAPAKEIDTIYLPDNKIDFIKKDLETFASNHRLYNTMGKMYKRNYILTGPPGTGKSSLARAMAGLYTNFLNVAITNGTDKEFLESVQRSNDGVILIEDIDCAKFSLGRDEGKGESITLSSLLNVLDGSYTKENMVAIITTNNPESLDPAITRPGRTDVILELGYLDEKEADDFIKFFENMFKTKIDLTHKNFSKVTYKGFRGYRPCDISERVFSIVKEMGLKIE